MTPEITAISSTELLQADTTIIAGILVLLTISSIYGKEGTSKFWGDLLIYIGIAPIPFIFSAGFLIEISLQPDVDPISYYQSALWAFISGLGLLASILFIIVTVFAKN